MAKRFTVSETEGRQQAYSYLLSEDLPLGSWTDIFDMPDEVFGEYEGLQGDQAPMFLYEPDGELVVTVSEAE